MKDPMPLEGEFILTGAPSPMPTISGNIDNNAVEPNPFVKLSPPQKSQNMQEQTILVLRGHIITTLPWVLFSIILIFIPILITIIRSTLFPFIQLSNTSVFTLFGFYYLVVSGYILLNFSLWYFNSTIITNKKVVDINLNGILNREINEAPLHAILDINYSQKGILSSLLNYGNIHLEIESHVEKLDVINTPNPEHTVKTISEIINQNHESN